MKIFKFLIVTALAVFCFSPVTQATEVQDIMLSDFYAFETTKNARTFAVYGTIENHGDMSVQLLKVELPETIAKKTDLHMNAMTADNVMTMRPIASVTIQPHDMVKLEPSGKHVMAMDVQKQLYVGDVIPLVLTFEHNREIAVNAKVIEAGMKPEEHNHPHHHHH